MKQRMLLALVVSLGLLHGGGWAFAQGPDASWSEIRSMPNLVIRAPIIWFGVHAISVLEVCRSGGTLRAQTSDGLAVEAPLPSASHSYSIEVNRIVGGIRHTREILLFVKQFEIRICGEP